MSAKVIKLIMVTDEESADRIVALGELSTKDRERSSDVFKWTDSDGRETRLHLVVAEIV